MSATYDPLGKRLPRPDAQEKTTGRATFAVDISFPDMLWGKVLRSIYPHARIINIDRSKAQRLPGVKAVVTAADLLQVERQVRPFWAEMRALARDRVRFIGEEVAAIAAVDEDTAEAALELIRVDYDLMPALMTPEEALAADAPEIHPGKGNLAAHFDISRGNPEMAFEAAACVVENKVSTPIQHQSYLESVGCVADYDPGGKLTLWLSNMDPSGAQVALANLFNLPASRVRVIQAHCGGAFGGKIAAYPIYAISCLLSRKAGRPVKMVNDREEEFLAAVPRVAADIELKIGAQRDGTLVAKEARILADNGAYLDLAPRVVAQMLVASDALYRVLNVRAQARVVYTNKSPLGAFRGFGQPQMLFGLETLLDRLAFELSMDPLKLRLKNAAQPGETSIHGWKISSCGLKECLKEAARLSEWEEKKRAKKPLHGLGMSCAIYYTSTRRPASPFAGSVAYLKILEDGHAQVISGEAEYGQGWNTVAAQIAAQELGIAYEDVSVTMPDTDFTPFSMGPWGLRVTVSGGNAVRLAAGDARRQLLHLAGQALEASPEDLEIKDGWIAVKGVPHKGIRLAEVARSAIHRQEGSAIMGKGVDEPEASAIDPQTLYGNISPAYVFGAQVAEIEVDGETGRIKVLKVVSAHDMGRPLNPMAAEGQVEGGLATGLGFALTEALFWDKEKVLNPNFLDYRLPTALDVPAMETIFVPIEEPNTVHGAKSIGQLATMMAPAALANAVAEACGQSPGSLPLIPEKTMNALESGRLGKRFTYKGRI